MKTQPAKTVAYIVISRGKKDGKNRRNTTLGMFSLAMLCTGLPFNTAHKIVMVKEYECSPEQSLQRM